jgi:cephalosporin hydroxylase
MINFDDYARWYFDSKVWRRVTYRGVYALKSVSDMWNYQEIIHDYDVQWVIEAGSCYGGSALFFGDLLAARGAAGHVISIDVDFTHTQALEHPKVEFLYGDSAAPDMIESVRGLLDEAPGRVFAILDSDHSKAHVLRELEAYVPLLKSGDYLVVEDTCVNGHPVYPAHGPGPWEAVETFLAANPGVLRHDPEREGKFGFTFAPHGFFIKI